MNKIVLFIDIRFPPSSECLKKVAAISTSFKQDVDLLIDVKAPHLERWYWPEFLEKNSIGDKTEEKAQAVISSIKQTLHKDRVNSVITRLDKTTLSSQISKLSGSLGNSLLLMEASLKETARAKFQELIAIHAPTLILTDKPWGRPVNLTVAIDPLHEHANETQVDNRLFDQAHTIKSKLKSDLSLLHSCYMPPMAVDYRKQVLQIHKDAVHEFAELNNIKANDINLVNGNPEETISSWVTSNHVDILAIGQFRRSNIKQYLLGSTSMTLIDKMLCDLLLVS